MYLFECLNDEEFPVICSPFEGHFHSIYTDFSFSIWTLRGRRPGCIGSRSRWTASSLKKKCLDAVHDRPVHPHFKHCSKLHANFNHSKSHRKILVSLIFVDIEVKNNLHSNTRAKKFYVHRRYVFWQVLCL